MIVQADRSAEALDASAISAQDLMIGGRGSRDGELRLGDSVHQADGVEDRARVVWGGGEMVRVEGRRHHRGRRLRGGA